MYKYINTLSKEIYFPYIATVYSVEPLVITPPSPMLEISDQL